MYRANQKVFFFFWLNFTSCLRFKIFRKLLLLLLLLSESASRSSMLIKWNFNFCFCQKQSLDFVLNWSIMICLASWVTVGLNAAATCCLTADWRWGRSLDSFHFTLSRHLSTCHMCWWWHKNVSTVVITLFLMVHTEEGGVYILDQWDRRNRSVAGFKVQLQQKVCGHNFGHRLFSMCTYFWCTAWGCVGPAGVISSCVLWREPCEGNCFMWSCFKCWNQ